MKTTKKQFLYFSKRVKYWFEVWGLHNWRCDVTHSKEESNDVRATACWAKEHHACTINLNTDTDEKLTNLEIDRTALHETWEVILSDFRSMAEATFSQDVVDEAIHDIIRRVENVVLKG